MAAHIPPAYKQISRSAVTLKVMNEAMLAVADGCPLHDALLTARGWPEIPFDGRLLVTQQDALLMGGKVQAMPGFADHVVFRNPELCIACLEKTCIAMCSGQAITLGEDEMPAFEREKMRPLRRVPVELRPIAGRRTWEHRIPRRGGRIALGGKLSFFTLSIFCPSKVLHIF